MFWNRRRTKSLGRDIFIENRVDLSRAAMRHRARANTRGNGGRSPVMIALLAAVSVVAGCALVWLLMVETGRALYSENPRFKIVTLEIRGARVLTREMVKEFTGIREGRNMFDFSIKKVRKDFLTKVPFARRMSISRVLPDTVIIEIEEREAVARVGSKDGAMVADRDGVVFFLRHRREDLPVILGYAYDIKGGDTLKGMGLAALDAIEACADPRLLLRLEAVDVSAPDHIKLYILCEGSQREILLAWKGMETRSEEGRQAAFKKLCRVAEILQTPEGKKYPKLNAMSDGDVRGLAG